MLDGFFHAYRHPGNVLVTDEGLLALIDLCLIGRLSPQMQERLLKLLLAISEGRGEDVAEVAMSLGEKLPEFNESSEQFASTKRQIAMASGRIGASSYLNDVITEEVKKTEPTAATK